MTDLPSIFREIRSVFRRANNLVTEVESALSADEISAEEYQIANASLEQAKQSQARLDFLISESSNYELSDAEEKEIEKIDALVGKIARLTGIARNIQDRFEKLHEPQPTGNPRHSWAQSTQFSMNASTLMRNKLPKIQLPTFDGDEQKFLNFKSQFVRLIHDNTEIENEDKMVFLKSSLTGKAERLIRDIPTSAANYQKAWDAIVERFEDRFLIVESHFPELFAIQRIKNTREIRDLIDQVDSVLRSLELSGETPNGWPGIIAYFVFSKLDERTQIDWKKTIQDHSKYAKWEDLRTFLKANASAVRVAPSNSAPQSEKESKKPKDSNESRRSFVVTQKPPCICCSKQHLIIESDVFQAKSARDRANLIRHHKLCPNCFNAGHNSFQCKSRKTCRMCSKKHHTLLHIEPSKPNAGQPSDGKQVAAPKQSDSKKTEQANPLGPPPTSSTSSSYKVISSDSTILLPSAVVPFESDAARGFLRSLLDTCSQPTLVSDAFVRRFRLRTKPSPNQFSIAVGGLLTATSRQCQMTLRSKYSDFSLEIVAEVVPSNALKYVVRNLQWSEQAEKLKKYNLADCAFHQKVVNITCVDLLLGAGYLPMVLMSNSEAFGQMMLKEMQFGWTILGSSAEKSEFSAVISPGTDPTCCLTIHDIDDNLKRLFEAETTRGQTESARMIQMHKECNAHFERTYERLPEGDFQVRNPYCAPISELTNNYRRALACLYRSEESNTGEKRVLYKEFMVDYRVRNHMSLIPNPTGPRNFLPHHAVLRPSSTTTKLRAVFNGSAKTASGKSLNDILMVGPKLQPDLFDILLNFRTFQVAFTADIAQMYRCIKMHSDDRPMQSILWRDDPSEPPQVYELNTVTYGLAPASFLATKCLQKLAESAQDEKVRLAIESNFYMDDLLTGANSVEEARALQKGIHELLASAKFNLRKYQSNSAELLKDIPPDLVETSLARILGDTDALSLLGVYWTPSEDVFRIRVPETEFDTRNVTKRLLLSEVACIFDPLGFVAPVTVREKIFIQSLWQHGLTWEQPAPEPLVNEFCALREERKLLSAFSVPRPFSEKSTGQYDIVGFCDASPQAFCAVVYTRLLSSQGIESVRFVCAKTHVAPVKMVTIPKLELCAAVLLAELLDRVRRVLRISIENVFAFSDSKVTLAWIAKPPETWKVYVENRVRKILAVLPYSNWGYVPTSENPADLATRSCTVSAFLESKLWKTGPEFLSRPFNIDSFHSFEENLELEKRKVKPSCHLAVDSTEFEFFDSFISRYSCFNRMTRIFAFILLYVGKLKARVNCKPPLKILKVIPPIILTIDDLSLAHTNLISLVQRKTYSSEFARLSEGKPVKKRSVLKSLNPYLKNNVIRLATRLTNAEVSVNRKRPIVLPASSLFVKLLIRHIHVKYFHATKSFIFSHLSVQYHVTGSLKNAIKAECNQCTICTRYRAETRSQIMGDLPFDRCAISRPFSATGVDLAGPFTCRPMTARSKVRFKIYVAVFVCFATRAVHLEVVSSLSTEDFLSAFQRFTSRRGSPKVVYSDNGTNFRGASKCFCLDDDKVQAHCNSEGIQWRFNPPRAPHRGGIWEAAVKSMKFHLQRVTKDQVMIYEQYATLLTRIEAILNSRPLCYKAGDPASVVLTSGHFLIGDRLTALPEFEQNSFPLTKRYECMQRQIQSFWLSWSKDYLSQLKTRTKWHKTNPNVSVGQVVLLRHDMSKPTFWPMGLIEATFPDKSGVVRTVQVRHNGSTKVRAISSIVPLPSD